MRGEEAGLMCESPHAMCECRALMRWHADAARVTFFRMSGGEAGRRVRLAGTGAAGAGVRRRASQLDIPLNVSR